MKMLHLLESPHERMRTHIKPFHSFLLSGIRSRAQLDLFVRKYVKSTSYGVINITPESHVIKTPVLIHTDNVTTVYSLKIFMGSFGEYPAASQLQLILRMTNYQHSNIFVELVLNIDEEVEAQNLQCDTEQWKSCIQKLVRRGYLLYATDPLVFLRSIQTYSNMEKQILIDMMRVDGIKISSMLVDNGEISNGKLFLQMAFYLKYDNFFVYKSIKNIRWTSTQNNEIYTGWLKHNYLIKQIIYKNLHYPYCFDSIRIPYPKNFISLIPGITQKDLMMFQMFCRFKDNRVFSDGEYDYDNIFCRIDINYIDRVYHIRCLKGSSIDYKVIQYELLIRMLGPQGCFYLEIIIHINNKIYELNDNIIFITRHPRVFMHVIQTGNKNHIANFIHQDEGWKVGEYNNLQTRCVHVLANYIIEKWNINTKIKWKEIIRQEIYSAPHIPHSLKPLLMYKGQWNLFVKHWKIGVKDITTRYLISNFLIKSKDNLIWNDDFNIKEFTFSWYLRHLEKR